MLLSYWSLALDNYNGLSEAFFAGILLDVLGGTLFGEHAFALVVTIVLIFRFKRQILMYTFTQQALFLLLLSFIYQTMIYIIEGVTRHQPQTLFFWGTLITTPLLWPWFFILLRDYRRRFRVA
jgi:rod shape-determining protein MreD